MRIQSIGSSGLALGGLALLASSCATLSSIERTAASVVVSDDQEAQLGLQVKSELETKQNVKYCGDPQVTEYVRGVAGKVLALAEKDRPAVKWQVNVIDDPGTINAFATPGGYLYVYTGLLLLADNEAQLAGVMGHEAGHVVARHSAQQMVDQFGLDAVAQLALGKNPGVLGQLGKTVVQKGAMLAHSRAHEDEADEYGARYSSAAGYDPHALSGFFTKLKAKVGDTNTLTTWLSDHPATSSRITHINSYAQQNGLNGKELGAARFVAMRARVAALPPNSGISGAPAPRAPAGSAPPN